MRISTICQTLVAFLSLSLVCIATANAVVINWDVDPFVGNVQPNGATNAFFGTRFTAEPILLAQGESELFDIYFKDLETGNDQILIMTHTLGFPYPESFNTIPTGPLDENNHFAAGYGPGIIIGNLTDYISARASLHVTLFDPVTIGTGNNTSFFSDCVLSNGNCEAVSNDGEAHNLDLTDGTIQFSGFRLNVSNTDTMGLVIREIGFNLTASGGIQAFTEQPTLPQDGGPTVPIPAAVYLFGSGILALVGMARRKKTV